MKKDRNKMRVNKRNLFITIFIYLGIMQLANMFNGFLILPYFRYIHGAFANIIIFLGSFNAIKIYADIKELFGTIPEILIHYKLNSIAEALWFVVREYVLGFYFLCIIPISLVRKVINYFILIDPPPPPHTYKPALPVEPALPTPPEPPPVSDLTQSEIDAYEAKVKQYLQGGIDYYKGLCADLYGEVEAKRYAIRYEGGYIHQYVHVAFLEYVRNTCPPYTDIQLNNFADTCLNQFNQMFADADASRKKEELGNANI